MNAKSLVTALVALPLIGTCAFSMPSNQPSEEFVGFLRAMDKAMLEQSQMEAMRQREREASKPAMQMTDIVQMEMLGLIPARPSDAQLKPVYRGQLSDSILGLHDASMQNWKASRDASKQLIDDMEKLTAAVGQAKDFTRDQAKAIEGAMDANGKHFKALQAEEKSLRGQLAGTSDPDARAAIQARINQVVAEQEALYAATQKLIGDNNSRIAAENNKTFEKVGGEMSSSTFERLDSASPRVVAP